MKALSFADNYVISFFGNAENDVNENVNNCRTKMLPGIRGALVRSYDHN
jgi:hypothetical protein